MPFNLLPGSRPYAKNMKKHPPCWCVDIGGTHIHIDPYVFYVPNEPTFSELFMVFVDLQAEAIRRGAMEHEGEFTKLAAPGPMGYELVYMLASVPGTHIHSLPKDYGIPLSLVAHEDSPKVILGGAFAMTLSEADQVPGVSRESLMIVMDTVHTTFSLLRQGYAFIYQLQPPTYASAVSKDLDEFKNMEKVVAMLETDDRDATPPPPAPAPASAPAPAPARSILQAPSPLSGPHNPSPSAVLHFALPLPRVTSTPMP